MAPKCTGTAVILVGLERIPVRVYPAVSEPPRLSFATVCKKHGVKVETVSRCPVDRKLIEKDEKEAALTKAYELGKGRFLTLSTDELEALNPEPDPEIRIEAVVQLEDIDPLTWNGKAQYLGADVGAGPVTDITGERAYAVLVDGLREAADGETAVAIGRWSVRGTDKLVAIRSKDRRLVVHELRRQGEIRDLSEIEPAERAQVSGLARLEPVLRRLQVEALDPSSFPDEKYEATVKLLQSKALAAAGISTKGGKSSRAPPRQAAR